jgi:CheY-like chemotaxis protein
MTDTTLDGATILVIDDEEDVRTYLGTVLEDAGARVVTAADGATGFDEACRLGPDLITLDLSMPGTDGVEAFTKLRREPRTETIPVCIITGHPEFRRVIYDRPVSPPEGYLDKPVDEGQLVSTVRRILALRRRRAWRSVRLAAVEPVDD